MGEGVKVGVGVWEGEGVVVGVALAAGRVGVGEGVGVFAGGTAVLAVVAVFLTDKGVEVGLAGRAWVALGRSVG